MSRTVLICCHQTCPKQGALTILKTFEQLAPENVNVVATGCFGECGNGPMVRILPDNIWYAHVQTSDVSVIVNQHLRHNQPVQTKLYRKFHQPNHKAIATITKFILFASFLLLVGGLCAILAQYTESF